MSDGFDYKIEFQNNSGIVLSEEKKAIERALYAMGIKAVEGAVDAISGRYEIDSAVDTGRLRASISYVTATGEKGDSGIVAINSKPSDKVSGKASENSVIVGSNVEYAEFVHNGTSKMTERPFLRVGIENTRDKMQSQVEKIFKGEL